MAPPTGELFSEINDNLMAILPTFDLHPPGWRRRGQGGVHGEPPVHEVLNGHQRFKSTHTPS
jgi:hypothetical protein